MIHQVWAERFDSKMAAQSSQSTPTRPSTYIQWLESLLPRWPEYRDLYEHMIGEADDADLTALTIIDFASIEIVSIQDFTSTSQGWEAALDTMRHDD